MAAKRSRWNPPDWPRDIEVVTFILFIIALLVPWLFGGGDAGTSATPEENGALAVGRHNLETQFGVFISLGIIGLYILHFVFAANEMNRLTVSPYHFLSPVFFALIAFVRISIASATALSPLLAILLIAVVIALNLFLMRRRHQRYMEKFAGTNWELVSPARYHGGYFKLIFEFRPLLYPPQRYLICTEGILIEGWHYALPIAFEDVHSVMRVSGSSILISGHYYASNNHDFVRIDLHDSAKDIFISPENVDEFVNTCLPHIARKKTSAPTSHGHHDMLHAAGSTKPGA